MGITLSKNNAANEAPSERKSMTLLRLQCRRMRRRKPTRAQSTRAELQGGERAQGFLYIPPLVQAPGPGLLRRPPHLQPQQQSLYFIHISLKTTESGRRSPRPSPRGGGSERALAVVWFSREGEAQTLAGAAKQLSLFALTVTHTGVTAAAGTGGDARASAGCARSAGGDGGATA